MPRKQAAKIVHKAMSLSLPLLAGLLLFSSCKQEDADGGGIDIRKSNAISLTLISQWPANEEIQVPISASIELTFDGEIHSEGLDTQFIWLEDSQGKTVAGSFLTRTQGRTVVFQPKAPLLEAEDYSLSIDANLCDVNMRAMDRTLRTRFRTQDKAAPKVLAVDLGGSQNSAPRNGTWRIAFDERIDPASIDSSTVQILDDQGTEQIMDLSSNDKTIFLKIVRDLPGSKGFKIRLKGGSVGISDVSGNPLSQDWLYAITTEVDNKPPVLVDMDPPNGAKGVSPRARHNFLFTESLVSAEQDSQAVRMVDKNSDAVSIQHYFSRDGRTLHVVLAQMIRSGDAYRVILQGGPQGISDVSGNALQTTYEIPFIVGTDSQGPVNQERSPAALQDAVSVNAHLQLGFDEALDSRSVGTKSFQLYQGSKLLPATVSMLTSKEIYLIPSKILQPATEYRVLARGGYDGILDVAGNPLDQDLDYVFRTGREIILPAFEIYPSPSSSSVPLDAGITFIANTRLMASTITKEQIRIIAPSKAEIRGRLTLERGNRVIRFDPEALLPALSVITVQIKGGASGIRLMNGNWLATDTLVSFRTGVKRDSGNRPQFRFSFNGIDPERIRGIQLPPSGFKIDISAYDSADGAVDMASLQLTLQGPGIVPTATELFALTRFKGNNASMSIDKEYELPVGKYKISAKVADSAGNQSETMSFDFSVKPPMSGDVPFENTQFVHVRFDLDREYDWKGNGVSDFDGDLYDLGLLAKGDPIGKNGYMRNLIIKGILGTVNKAYGRAIDGSTLPDSVNIRFMSKKPCGSNYMQIALGGMDPMADSSRKFGDKTSGILGRAWYDYKNSNYRDDNTWTRPGLGVFTGELFLHQARVYLDLKKWYLSTWGRTYDGLSPHLSGTPVGRHALDSKILATGWDYERALSNERARWNEIMRGADDFARVAGTILAHEIGHATGLVAPGGLPTGLHGDRSLHNSRSGLGNIMSPVIGYEGMLVVEHSFRALNKSYLRQRTLLK